MTRTLAVGFALLCSFTAAAEGPGSRIGTTPEVPPLAPIPSTAAPSPEDAKRCAALTGERKAQCLADLRAEPASRSTGPGSIGGSPGGASSTVGSGTTGGGSFGGSAPR